MVVNGGSCEFLFLCCLILLQVMYELVGISMNGGIQSGVGELCVVCSG
jgi:hypothetical protein